MSARPRRARVVASLAAVTAVLAVAALVLDRFDVPTKARRWARARLIEKLDLRARSPSAESLRRAYLEPLEPVAATTPTGTVRLLGLPLESVSGTDVQPVRVQLDGATRQAVGGAVPFRFRTRLRLPDAARLWLALDQVDVGLDVEGLAYHVRVVDETAVTTVSTRRRPSWQSGWENLQIDLAAWSGRELDLEFEVTTLPVHGPSTDPSRSPARAYLADLFIGSAESRALPNVVLVLIDTLRPDHLGAYGYERPTSPTMDSLAAEGVRFERAFSSAPWTDPSILSLMTGLHPSDLWEPGDHLQITSQRLPGTVDTLAGQFARGGWFSIAASDHPGINAQRFGRGFDVFVALHHGDGSYTGWRETAAQNVLARIDALLGERRGGGLFLYVHILYPHRPYAPPPAYAERFGPGFEQLVASERMGVVNRYDAEIRLADDVVASLLRLLAAHGLGDDAIVALLSDHGEGFWDHGDLSEHGNSLYNELLRIPLILHAPGRLDGGRVVPDVVRMVDVAPTLLELAGLPPPIDGRGRSLVRLARGEEDPGRLAWSEFPHSRIVPAQSLQSNVRKLVALDPATGERQAFDLSSDPGERSLAGSGDDPLEREMRTIRRTAAERRAQAGRTELQPDPETLERLRALGYVE